SCVRTKIEGDTDDEQCKENCSFTINLGRDDRIYTGGDSSRIQVRRNFALQRGLIRPWNRFQVGGRDADLQGQRLSGQGERTIGRQSRYDRRFRVWRGFQPKASS